MESESQSESLEQLVDDLLHDNDYLLAQELKLRVDELNALLKQADKQGLRLTLSVSNKSVDGEPAGLDADTVRLALKIFKEI